MMKKIAFVFTQSPHGSSAGREGLDAVLATSAFSEQIGLFFISDGVFQLLPNQMPENIHARDYIATFGVLELYDVTDCFICSDSLLQRGLPENTPWVIDVTSLTSQQISDTLSDYDVVLTF